MENNLGAVVGLPVTFEVKRQFTKVGVVVSETNSMLNVAWLNYYGDIKIVKRKLTNIKIILSSSTQYTRPLDKLRQALDIEKFNLI